MIGCAFFGAREISFIIIISNRIKKVDILIRAFHVECNVIPSFHCNMLTHSYFTYKERKDIVEDFINYIYFLKKNEVISIFLLNNNCITIENRGGFRSLCT